MSSTWYRSFNYFLQTCFTISTSLFLILIPLHWFKQPCFTLQLYSISFCPYNATFQFHVFSDPTSFPQTFCWLASLLYYLLPDLDISIQPPVLSSCVFQSIPPTWPLHLSIRDQYSYFPCAFESFGRPL